VQSADILADVIAKDGSMFVSVLWGKTNFWMGHTDVFILPWLSVESENRALVG
jgi:hypothetical protein